MSGVDAEAVVAILAAHADCTLNDSQDLGAYATGSDVWSCGIVIPFGDDLDEAERTHLATAITNALATQIAAAEQRGREDERERAVDAASRTATHPEEYCHRCGGPNISWFTPGAVWDPVMRPVPGAPWKWHEIICPLCFVELAGGGTWTLLPAGADGGPWTSWDERERIKSEATADLRESLSEMADSWEFDVEYADPDKADALRDLLDGPQ